MGKSILRHGARVKSLMTKQPVLLRKRRGPLATGPGHPVQVRLQPNLLAALDLWIAKRRDGRSRPEAIRQILERMLGPEPDFTGRTPRRNRIASP